MAEVLTSAIVASVWEDGDAVCMARVVGKTRANITQASLASISRKVFDLSSDTPDTAITAGTATITIASSVFDTLQTDARWTKDATGYNFLDTIPAGVFANGGHVYQAEYKFTAVTTGEVGWVKYQLTAQPVRTS